jgi:predicted HAD superfamily hydrolase
MRVFSFDIFDTCLSRVSSLPSSVFYLMAKAILSKDAEQQEIFEFVNERMRAEEDARTKTIPGKKEEVTLEEIYDHFRMEIPGFTKQSLLELEKETEVSLLRPVYAAQKKIGEARDRGLRVIFVSDIYLPESLVRERLEHFGLFRQGDGLYVSSTIGLVKSTGSLFDYVREKEGVAFREIHHFGDHYYADVEVPSKKGIRTTVIGTGLNKYEFAWNNQAYALVQPFDVYLMSGISKSIRLANKYDVHDNIVLNAIAPLFVPFVSWLLRDARKRGLRKLYFLARDGYVLHKIALVLGVHYPEIELHYLYGSRRAFYLAGVKDASREELKWIFPAVLGKTPKQMLRRINADPSVLQKALEKRGLGQVFIDQPLSASSYGLFLDLLSEPESKTQLLAMAAQQRELVKAYFSQEGLCCDGNSGIVDIGWSRFCHHAVNVILEPHHAFGYFFGVFKNRVSMREGGSFSAAFYPEEFYNDECNKNLLIHEFLPILEQFFTLNNQRSTTGFIREGDRIVPVFEDHGSPVPEKEAYFQKHIQLVTRFAEEYLRFEPFIQQPDALVRNCGYRSVTMLMTEPSHAEASIFDGFMVDNGVGDPVPLVRKIGLLQMARKAMGSGAASSAYVWPEGSIVRSFGERGLQLLKVARALKDFYKRGRYLTKPES